MNRTEFYTEFASYWNDRHDKEMHIPVYRSKELCISVFDFLAECIDKMGEDERVYIKGFGTFRRKTQKARKIGSFLGGTMVVPEKSKIIFEPSVISDAGDEE